MSPCQNLLREGLIVRGHILHNFKVAYIRNKFTNTAYNLSVFCVQLSESLTESIVPFDATSETPLEEQRIDAMVRVQDALLARLGPEALGLLRAAR